MAFPITRSAFAGTQGTNASSWTLTYPGAGDILDGGGAAIVAGDLIMVNIARDGATGTGSITDYQSLFDQAASGSVARGLTFVKVAAGSESGNFTYTVGASEQGAWRVAVIKDWFGTIAGGAEASAAATGANANPDPPNFDPSWGTVDTFWRAVFAADDGRTNLDSYPANYTIYQNSDKSNGSGGANMGSAGRQSAVAAENPGTFTKSGTGSAAGWVAWVIAVRPSAATIVTPGTASLTTTLLTPTVTATAHQTVTPGVVALTLTPQTPTVTATDHQTVTPGTVGLTATAQTPTVTASDHQTVTPGVTALTVTPLTPTVTTSANVTATPDVASLTLTPFTPTVSVPADVEVVPGVASLTLAAQTPTVTATDNIIVTPGVVALNLAAFAPTVSASDHQTVTPGVLALALTAFEPSVSAGVSAVPGVAALTLTALAPDVTATANQLVTPGTVALVLTAYAPYGGASGGQPAPAATTHVGRRRRGVRASPIRRDWEDTDDQWLVDLLL